MKDFEQSLKGDPRLAELSIARRNFERTAPPDYVEAVRGIDLFPLYEHLLKSNVTAHVNANMFEFEGVPKLHWRTNDNPPGNSHLNIDLYDTPERRVSLSLNLWDYDHLPCFEEELPFDEFRKPDVVKTIIYDFLQVGGFRIMEVKQLDFKGLDPDGYFEILKLHPLAFADLTEDEASELLDKVYRFASFKYHPDRGGNSEVMRRINEARDFFENPANRKP